jgi:hypothetical protein
MNTQYKCNCLRNPSCMVECVHAAVTADPLSVGNPHSSTLSTLATDALILSKKEPLS